MKAYLIDTEAKEARVVEIDDSNHLTEYYKHLNCYLIDITRRQVGGRYFDIIVDDEGLFADNPIVSAIDSQGEPALVGNLLFCNHDGHRCRQQEGKERHGDRRQECRLLRKEGV